MQKPGRLRQAGLVTHPAGSGGRCRGSPNSDKPYGTQRFGGRPWLFCFLLSKNDDLDQEFLQDAHGIKRPC